MTYSEIYSKLDEEVQILRTYIEAGQWKQGKSEFFETPIKRPLPAKSTTAGGVFGNQLKGKPKSGVYFFSCIQATRVLSVADFNKGKGFAKMRMTDSGSVAVKEGEMLYIGQCGVFSSRMSAHLDGKSSSKTGGLHLYSRERRGINPNRFALTFVPLKDSFYPLNCADHDRQILREAIELKLKAVYLPLVGK